MADSRSALCACRRDPALIYLAEAVVVNISRIDLNLFVVLNAIYTEGGITRASERLSLTQPAISHSLARLRDLLDDPLFVREGHAMVPTPLTQSLIVPIRRALNEIEGSLNQINQFDPGTSTRTFRIGMRHIVETGTLPSLVSRVRAVAPAVQIAAVMHEREALPSSLALGELDAAIDILLPRAPNLAFAPLSAGQLVVAARADHPSIVGHLDLDTYLSLDHILATSRPTGPGLEDMALQRLGKERRIAVRCQQFWTACQVVARTDLLVTMPERFAREVNSALGNRIHPFPLSVPANEIYLYWHANAENEPGNVWLRNLIQACF